MKKKKLKYFFINFQKIHRHGRGSINVYKDYKEDYLKTIVIEDKTLLFYKDYKEDYLDSWKSSATLGKKLNNEIK